MLTWQLFLVLSQNLWNINETCYKISPRKKKRKKTWFIIPMFLNPPQRNPPISPKAGERFSWPRLSDSKRFFDRKARDNEALYLPRHPTQEFISFHNQSCVSSRILSLFRCLLDLLELLSYRSLASLNIYTYDYIHISVWFIARSPEVTGK